MKRAITLLFVSLIALGACTQRMICPAYQSAFIYDKEALRKKFSYFQDDTTPKVLMASKNKYLIATPTTYQKKVRSLQTVEMKPVYPVVPDSLRDDFVPLADLDSAARSVIDSTYIVDVNQKADTTETAEDSVYVITKDKEVRLLKYNPDSLKYKVVEVRLNVDQDNYMWYLRNHLILPDVKIAKMQSQAKANPKKEKKGFFRNLFKRKKKETPDSTLLTTPVRDENDFDYIDTLAQEKTTVETDKPSKKKNKKKKKQANVDENADVEKDAAVAPEEKPKRKRKKKDAVEPEDTDKPSRMGDQEDEVEKDDGF